MVLVAGALVVRAQSAVVFAASDVRSMFHISKSQNRNQVHYGLRLNAQCVPTSASPVFAYWRELEQGPDHLSELLDREQTPYGVAPGQVVSMRRGKARVEFRLRPFPDRALVASPRSRARGCAASVVTNVAGRPAVLESIHVAIGFLWQVESITITAHTTANEVLREVLAD
jgi:hypothetical protein